MEDVLAVYARPYDPHRPVVCVDEAGKELHAQTQPFQRGTPGQIARQDYEYSHHGSTNLFLWVEPLAGRRGIHITARRTRSEFAEFLRFLVEEQYARAERVVLVTDNLNTHGPWALYETLAPAHAAQIAAKIEWHYTPEHGSWLNMAELELSVLRRQCLNRRIGDRTTLAAEVAAWERERNHQARLIDWQFTTAAARIKLKRLYPVYGPDPAAEAIT